MFKLVTDECQDKLFHVVLKLSWLIDYNCFQYPHPLLSGFCKSCVWRMDSVYKTKAHIPALSHEWSLKWDICFRQGEGKKGDRHSAFVTVAVSVSDSVVTASLATIHHDWSYWWFKTSDQCSSLLCFMLRLNYRAVSCMETEFSTK